MERSAGFSFVSTGEALIKAMQASPYRDLDVESRREPMPVRDISL